MAIRIITDSSSDITQEEAKQLNIDVIPLTVSFGDEVFTDGIDLSVSEFYARMRSAKVLPKTSLINSETMQRRFSVYPDDDVIIGIFISSELSGSLQSAFVARENLPNHKIYLIDSRQVTFGLAALVHVAIRLRDAGKSALEIVAAIEEAKKHLFVFAVIDDLKYLKLGGRLSSASAVLGTIMGVKPLIAIEDGKVMAVHKAFGLTRGFAWLTEQYLAQEVDKTMPRFYGHSDAEETLEQFKKFVTKRTDFEADHTSSIGITVGTHAGPGAVGFCFFRK